MSCEKNGKEAPMVKNRHWRFSQPLKNLAIQIRYWEIFVISMM